MEKNLKSVVFLLKRYLLDKHSFLKISKGYNRVYLTTFKPFNLNFLIFLRKSTLNVEFAFVLVDESNHFKLVYKLKNDSFKNQIGNLSSLSKILKKFNLKLSDNLIVEDVVQNFND